ncbi:MAG: sigma-70 family RNA polymerase sigma factor [Candidatus Latescibacteria bacterium]|nr:sigma-70 family RNA polymerase sigma factor [Candidatus Latescibacterota bacterium]
MQGDAALVAANRRGDTKAFSLLVDRYRYAVFGLCLGHTQDPDVAEDMAQEAFVKAFLRLPDLADPGRFAPWVKQIAVNECRMWHRRRAGERTAPAGVELVHESPEENLLARETHRRILSALGRLNEGQQQIVSLFYLEDMALKQIAAFLDISPQTANQRLYRARTRLKEEMMSMVKDSLQQQQLPDDFTAAVVAKSLERGRQWLDERRWPEAKAEFRKITAALPDHLDAQRGLALALDGQVNTMLAESEVENDDKLVQEAVAALEEAYRLGARDWETVWNLAGFYETLKRDTERSVLLEAYADEGDDGEKAFFALVRAAWSSKRVGDHERGYALHQRALSLPGRSLQERLRSYFAGVIPIYAHADKADQWLQQTAELYGQLQGPLSLDHYMYYRDTCSVLVRCGRSEQALEEGHAYLGLLDSQVVDDPIQRRWWISDTWAQIIRIQGAEGAREELQAAQQQAAANIAAYEAEWEAAEESEADTEKRQQVHQNYRRFAGYAAINLALAYHKAGLYEEAVELFERKLSMYEKGTCYMQLAAVYMDKGDRQGALDTLRRLHQSAVTSVESFVFLGQARAWFNGAGEFESVRQDPEFVAVVGQQD